MDSLRSPTSKILGVSKAILALKKEVERVGPTDQREHLHGPTGSGKDVFAEAIHRASQRANRPFVPVNCGELTPALAQSALFGHAKGAFTGAIADRIGYFERAADGTLFLDEIGDLPLEVQVMILRVIESGTFERVGSQQPIAFRARIISATHRDMKQLIAEARFRADLYYRLCQHVLEVPPLCERFEDVPVLAQAFLRETEATGVTREALSLLRRYAWPGNVRELRNAIRSLGIECTGRTVRPHDVLSLLSITVDERAWLAELLREVRGNVSELARRLGVRREAVHRKMARLGIDSGTGRAD